MKQAMKEQMKTRFSLKRAGVVVALVAALGGVYLVCGSPTARTPGLTPRATT